HLISGGRRRIATIAGPQDMGVGLDRLAGYREALAEAGLPEYVEYCDFGEASGIIATERLLAAESALDAVFAADDPMALGALRVLRRHGRRVPGDVAVIGFDDSAAAPLADPPLTTVHQSVGEMGVEMAR
ncbi:substrate-binding domain-containing protein, partial [Enterococcus faecium]|uniref:substrate-binding domain-containing protein n=1 Tax=Enterococcus faecium TaxID=1352 RepID=UPI00164FF492